MRGYVTFPPFLMVWMSTAVCVCVCVCVCLHVHVPACGLGVSTSEASTDLWVFISFLVTSVQPVVFVLLL